MDESRTLPRWINVYVGLAVLFVMLPILVPVIVLWTMPAEARLFGWALGVAVSAGMLTRMTLDRRRFQREAADAAGTREDLLVFWRRDVDRRIGMLRFWPVNIMAAILLPLPAILDHRHALPTGGAALVYGLALFMLIQGLYYGVVVMPRVGSGQPPSQPAAPGAQR